MWKIELYGISFIYRLYCIRHVVFFISGLMFVKMENGCCHPEITRNGLRKAQKHIIKY